nr:MAG TPA: hypothetical protein [Caudoviricetes sp.]
MCSLEAFLDIDQCPCKSSTSIPCKQNYHAVKFCL